eukprot:TRINITY_DN43405_c0_g1_i1.p1 TRINITY_DN43405_c0_g1~~TRINITY_DN43405_c0_g1_i1.p1  ORF type:complete len:106 (+),score=32.64 TRINITY_DN43405_c0_g1_i1:67-384(+)
MCRAPASACHEARPKLTLALALNVLCGCKDGRIRAAEPESLQKVEAFKGANQIDDSSFNEEKVKRAEKPKRRQKEKIQKEKTMKRMGTREKVQVLTAMAGFPGMF